MKLDVRIQLLRFCSVILNSVFLALGVSVVGCGAWILFDRGNFLNVLSSVELRTVGAGLLLIGCVVSLVSAVGCWGAHGENRFLLLLYMTLLVVLVLGQLFVTLLLVVSRDKISRSLEDTLDQVIRGYPDLDNGRNRLLDDMQHYAQCCGMTGSSDWLENSFVTTLNLTSADVLPCSCFDSFHQIFNSSWCSNLWNLTHLEIGHGNNTYPEGCKTKLTDWLTENGLTILGMALSLIFIQVLQFVISIYLYKAFNRKASLKRADSNPAHKLDDGEQNYAYVDSELYHDDPNSTDPDAYHN